jgi:hypothetical protein
VLRLATFNAEPLAAPSTSAPTLAIYNRNPWADSREQHRTPSGRLLPPLHRYDRIHLRTQHATKAWRVLADRLEAANLALVDATPSNVEERLDQWLAVAKSILASRDAKPSDFRTLLDLVAMFAGCRRPHTVMHPGYQDSTSEEIAFSVLDWQLYRSRDGDK